MESVPYERLSSGGRVHYRRFYCYSIVHFIRSRGLSSLSFVLRSHVWCSIILSIFFHVHFKRQINGVLPPTKHVIMIGTANIHCNSDQTFPLGKRRARDTICRGHCYLAPLTLELLSPPPGDQICFSEHREKSLTRCGICTNVCHLQQATAYRLLVLQRGSSIETNLHLSVLAKYIDRLQL